MRVLGTALALLCACGSVTPGTPSDGAIADDVAPGDDAAPIDAGRDFSSDRSQFFGASRCATSGTVLCDDFESGTLDTTTWQTAGQAPTIDGLQAARGTKALHISRTGNGQSYIRETKTFPALAGGYYARAFIYFTKMPGAPLTYAHWTAFASATDIGEIRIGGQFQNGKNLWGVGTDSATGTGDWTNNDKDPNNAPVTIPLGTWQCIEWHHDPTNDTTEFWWDGVLHPSLGTIPTTPHGGNASVPYTLNDITSVWFGWFEYQMTTLPFEMWIDEIAVDSARIGCVQ